MKKALIALLLLLALPLGALFALNLWDEDLDANAAAFIKTERPGLAPEQNGFYYLAGFGAALSEDPHAAGRSWLAEVEAAQARMLAGGAAEWPATPKGFPKLGLLCSPDRDSCVRWVKEKAEARQLLAEHRQVIERYRRLHAYPAFADMTDARLYSYPLLSYVPWTEAQRLFLMDVARRLEAGDSDALAALGAEIALARRMLAGSRSILQKMVATAQFTRTALFASDALAAHRERIGARAGVLADALRPLSAEERRLLPALRAEAAMMASAMDPARWRGDDLGLGLDAALLKPLYQHRASINLIYRSFYQPWAEVDGVPSTQLEAAIAKAKSAAPQFPAWTAAYNPVGKLLLAISAPALSGYFERMHDLDALARMVALQAEIVANGVRDENVGAFVAAQAQRNSNPYTGKAFGWDATARQLWFEPRSSFLKERNIGGTAGRIALTI